MKDAQVPLLEIHNATIWRESTRVFEALSLEIQQGESLAIVGPNGSGKSTLAKVLSREIYPVRGPDSYVRLLGRERFSAWDYRRAIGVVAEDVFANFPEATTCLEAVLSAWTLSAGLRGIRADIDTAQRQAARDILTALGIGALAERRIGSVSTGQLRRTMLSRALVTAPGTLILDEPMTGLDLQASYELLSLIRDQSRAGTGIVLITHHIGDIPPEVDRVLTLKNGRIVCDGTKADVLTSAHLSELYGTPLRVVRADDFYLTVPAT